MYSAVMNSVQARGCRECRGAQKVIHAKNGLTSQACGQTEEQKLNLNWRDSRQLDRVLVRKKELFLSIDSQVFLWIYL